MVVFTFTEDSMTEDLESRVRGTVGLWPSGVPVVTCGGLGGPLVCHLIGMRFVSVDGGSDPEGSGRKRVIVVRRRRREPLGSLLP